MEQTNENSRSKHYHLNLADKVIPIGMMLKSQGAILRGWGEVKDAQLSPDDVAALGDLLQELGQRICEAAGQGVSDG